MPASQVIKHWRDGTIVLTDGAAHSLTVPFSMGDFKLSGLSADMFDVKVYKVRGVKQTVRKGESVEPTGSFSCSVADFSDAANSTVHDFCRKANLYSGNTSTMSASSTPPGDIYAVQIVWNIEGTDMGDPADHSVTCTHCQVTMDLNEGEPDTISFNFTVYGTVTLS